MRPNKKVDYLSELDVERETYDVTVYSTHILNFRSDSDQLRLVVITLHFSLHFDNLSLFLTATTHKYHSSRHNKEILSGAQGTCSLSSHYYIFLKQPKLWSEGSDHTAGWTE